MTGKDKFIYVLLSIVTLGIFNIVVKNKKTKNVSTELSSNDKITVNVVKLQNSLGGKNNIVGVEYTQTKVKIFIKNRAIVNIEEINNLKNISGVVATSKYVTIIVGKQAKKLSESI